MKIYKLPLLCESSARGQYLLGPEELDTEAVYLVYGRLGPMEKDRRISPAKGREEIMYVVKGAMEVRRSGSSFTVTAGEALHLMEEDTIYIDNPDSKETVYILAGGRSGTPCVEPPRDETEEPLP